MKNTLQEKFRALRQQMNLTQAQIGELLDTNQCMISYIENGKHHRIGRKLKIRILEFSKKNNGRITSKNVDISNSYIEPIRRRRIKIED